MSSLSATVRILSVCSVFCLPAASVWGGWAAFGEEKPPDSGLVWVNRPAAVRTHPATLGLDPGLELPAVNTGAAAGGSPRFRIAGEGEYVVEVFVRLVARSDAEMVLESGGRMLDGRLRADGLRLYPGSKRVRTWALIGAVRGGEEFQLRSTYAEFLLVGARWTPRGEFEKDIAPKLAERIRRMAADPFYEGRNQNRAPRLRELGDLAMESRQPAIRREGLLGTARGTYWVAAENHEPRDIRLLGELLDVALAEMPDHPIIRQMASAACAHRNTGGGRGMPCTAAMRRVGGVAWAVSDRTPLEGAPAWAAAQWRLRARVEELTRYWVRERQRENGELAGGWGDDVEILRQWGPIALGLGSAMAEEGVRKVALGVWASGILKEGYNARIEDVEHSAEPSSDTLPLLAAIDPFGEETRSKLAVAAGCAENWIARQADGQWRFQSSWFNCREHDAAPERAVDVHLNVRAMGPALWHAWLQRDARLIELVERWAESWRAAMHSTAHGKPRGMIPAAVRAADGNYLLGATWEKPDVEWDYFQWTRGSQESVARLFLALHDLTAKPQWMEAAREAFAAVKAPLPVFSAAAGEGELLARATAEMEQAEAALAFNFDMQTREAIYTDRVYYALPGLLSTHLFGGDAPRGDRAPAFAVTWPPVAGRFARMVTAADGDSLQALIYSFETGASSAKVRLWRLKPGSYRWRAGEASGELVVKGLPVELTVPVTPRREIRLSVSPAAR